MTKPAPSIDAPELSAPKSVVRVALVEDQRDMRESWKRLIDSLPDFRCAWVCASGEEAVKTLPAAKPDVILMDIFMPNMSGIECTGRLRVLLPESRIVILTASDDDEMVFLALEAGADGYLLKRTKPMALRTALLDVLNGGAPMSSVIARRVVESFRRNRTRDASVHLTAREEEVLVLLSKGYSNKEIGERLNVGFETARSHLKNIYEKMHVRSRAEAVARYMSSKPAVGQGE